MKNATKNCPKTEARSMYQKHVNTLTNGGSSETSPIVRAQAKNLALTDVNNRFVETERNFSEHNPHGLFHITEDFNHLNEVISEIQRY